MSDHRPPTRRQLLRGASGITLALPFLSSLLPRGARADTTTPPPRLVMFNRSHGNVRTYNDVADALLPNKLELYSGHQISWGPLKKTLTSGKAVVTPIVQASSAALTDRLLGKLNILRGLDNCTAVANHTMASFGAIGFELGAANGYAVPSVDQFAAWSPSYYRAGSYKLRSIVAGPESWSFNFQNAAARTGAISKVAGDSDPVSLFNKLFTGFTTTPPTNAPPPRKPLVDHVLESYRELRNSNRRLSAEDARRLDAHLEMMRDLQSRISAVPTAGAGCSKPATPAASTPATPAANITQYQLYNDLIVAAFKCGLTRIATVSPMMMGTDIFRDTGVQWHNLDPALAALSRQVHFEKVVLDLATKLDVDEGDGKTYLDNSLIISTSDAGADHHRHTDVLMVTLGGASGFFKTGLYVDYRNRAKRTAGAISGNPGIGLQQFWANVLDAVRIPRAEWQSLATNGGWGTQAFGDVAAPADYAPGVLENAGAKLPVVL